ncbi:MAG: GIY-YIG nuclease family protein [Patescibacteria group bacterium]
MPRQNQHNYFTYITTNKRHTVFYVGVTNSLERRVWQHKHRTTNSFTKRYNVDKLVYYEHFDFIESAIEQEKKFKKLSRRNKVLLITKFNPEWKDLFSEFPE